MFLMEHDSWQRCYELATIATAYLIMFQKIGKDVSGFQKNFEKLP